MIAAFQVGSKETHRVEVHQPFIGTTMTIMVDDVVIAKHKPPYGIYSYTYRFSCGVNEAHEIELRINYYTFKYEAYLDGKIFIGCLFPQAVGYNALGLAIMANVIAAIALVMAL